ncbi:hypothetical protein HanIR_Chr12g0585541 [Helianthus annuus]|nr:hypothetical protein HanIR_Chr12g0585541 [Helianthus annuus]
MVNRKKKKKKKKKKRVKYTTGPYGLPKIWIWSFPKVYEWSMWFALCNAFSP